MSAFYALGKGLRRLRYERDLSQSELARLAGLHKAQISKYERDVDVPSIPTLDRLLDALGAGLSDLETTLEAVRELEGNAEDLEKPPPRVVFTPPRGLRAEEQARLAAVVRSFAEFMELLGERAKS